MLNIILKVDVEGVYVWSDLKFDPRYPRRLDLYANAAQASMKNTVARLELQINNQEEEVNDLEEAVNSNDSRKLEAALKSKRQELESSRAQLRAAKAKLASAQSAVVESYVLADATGGAQAAGADSVASRAVLMWGRGWVGLVCIFQKPALGGCINIDHLQVKQ